LRGINATFEVTLQISAHLACLENTLQLFGEWKLPFSHHYNQARAALTAFKAQQASAIAVQKSLVKAFTDTLKRAIRALEWKIGHFAEKTSFIPTISKTLISTLGCNLHESSSNG
jgi:hypothetical protein